MRAWAVQIWRQVRSSGLPTPRPGGPKAGRGLFRLLLAQVTENRAAGAVRPPAPFEAQLPVAPGALHLSPTAAGGQAPTAGSDAQAQGTPATPPPGLIKVGLSEPGSNTSGLWWDPATNTYWTGDYTTGQWYSLGQAQERPEAVQVAPHIEVPLGLYAMKHVGLGVRRTVPGAGAWVGGQFVQAGNAGQARRIWQNQASPEELAFMQVLSSVLPHPLLQRGAAAHTNPREYFRDDQVYADLLRERGVPQTPEEAVAFWQEYQRRVYEKKVQYARIVGLDPNIYPPPDTWPDVLDQVGKPPEDSGSGSS